MLRYEKCKFSRLFLIFVLGFGCNILAFDIKENADIVAMGGQYVSLDELFANADVISLHTPLFPATKHIINAKSISKMKTGVMLLNTSRGGLVDTQAVIDGLKTRRIGYLGLDVYENEHEYFLEDHSGEIMLDDTFAKLFTFPNVLVTGHQAYLTHEALTNIASITIQNVLEYENQSTSFTHSLLPTVLNGTK